MVRLLKTLALDDQTVLLGALVVLMGSLCGTAAIALTALAGI